MYFFKWIRCLLNIFKISPPSKLVNLYDKIYDFFFTDQIKNIEIQRIRLLLKATEIMGKYRIYNKNRILRYINQYHKLSNNDPNKRALHQLLNLFKETPYGITRTCMRRTKSSWFWFGIKNALVFVSTPLVIESQTYGMDGVLWYSYDIFIAYDWYFITNELTRHGNEYVFTVTEIKRLFPVQTNNYSLVGIPLMSRTLPFPLASHINSEFLSPSQSLEIIHFFNQYGNL